jgi:hypothetical protein
MCLASQLPELIWRPVQCCPTVHCWTTYRWYITVGACQPGWELPEFLTVRSQREAPSVLPAVSCCVRTVRRLHFAKVQIMPKPYAVHK